MSLDDAISVDSETVVTLICIIHKNYTHSIRCSLLTPKFFLIIFQLLPHPIHCLCIPICLCCIWSWGQCLSFIATVLNKVFLAILNKYQNDLTLTILKNICPCLSPWGFLYASIRTRGVTFSCVTTIVDEEGTFLNHDNTSVYGMFTFTRFCPKYCTKIIS